MNGATEKSNNKDSGSLYRTRCKRIPNQYGCGICLEREVSDPDHSSSNSFSGSDIQDYPLSEKLRKMEG